MEQILKSISRLSISIEEAVASEARIKNGWLGFEPASEELIKATEQRLGLKLPEDYINFLKITNGFSAPNQIEPSFIPVQRITFVKDSVPFLIEAYSYLEELERAIFISGEDEEQHFFLIYPKSKNEKWKYWKFANWYPGEHEFESLESYFANALEFIENDVND